MGGTQSTEIPQTQILETPQIKYIPDHNNNFTCWAAGPASRAQRDQECKNNFGGDWEADGDTIGFFKNGCVFTGPAFCKQKTAPKSEYSSLQPEITISDVKLTLNVTNIVKNMIIEKTRSINIINNIISDNLLPIINKIEISININNINIYAIDNEYKSNNTRVSNVIITIYAANKVIILQSYADVIVRLSDDFTSRKVDIVFYLPIANFVQRGISEFLSIDQSWLAIPLMALNAIGEIPITIKDQNVGKSNKLDNNTNNCIKVEGGKICFFPATY